MQQVVPSGPGLTITLETLSALHLLGIDLDIGEVIALERLTSPPRGSGERIRGGPDEPSSLDPPETTPIAVSHFIAELLRAYGVRRARVSEETSSLLALGLAHRSREIEYISDTAARDVSLASLLAPNGRLKCGTEVREYDCLVVGQGSAPAKAGDPDSDPGLIRAEIQAREFCQNRLGLVIALLPSAYLRPTVRRDLVRDIGTAGLELAALLSTPAHGGLASCGMLVAVIARGDFKGELFVAEVPLSEDQQRELSARIVERKPGDQAIQGKIVPERGFSGLDRLDERDRIARLASRKGLSRVLCRDIFADLEFVNRDADGNFPQGEDTASIYVPFTGEPGATCALAGIADGVRSVLRISVKPEAAHARYIALMINGEMGAALRGAIRATRATSRRMLKPLLDQKLYLPSLDKQAAAVEAIDLVARLRADLSEVDSRIWSHPQEIETTLERIRQVNRKDTREEWGESLPFPLSSILRFCDAQHGNPKAQCEALLHFFEATAAFLATVHLSAAARDPARWIELKDRIDGQMVKQSMSWSLPTFGMWRLICRIAIGIVRPRLSASEGDADSIRALYGISSVNGMAAFIESSVQGVLEEVNHLRNIWVGHGGTVSDSEALERYEQLHNFLDRLRAGLGDTFNRMQLVIPGDMKMGPDGVFSCEVHLAEGSNPAFLKRRVSLTEPVESGRLVLLEDGSTKPLPLLATVQILGDSQPVCYFFNRVDVSGTDNRVKRNEEKGTVFVSYHHAAKSRVVYPDMPADIAKLVATV